MSILEYVYRNTRKVLFSKLLSSFHISIKGIVLVMVYRRKRQLAIIAGVHFRYMHETKTSTAPIFFKGAVLVFV